MMTTHQNLLTQEMVARIQAKVALVVAECGWGRVVVVIEKGQPKRIETTTDEWLVLRE